MLSVFQKSNPLLTDLIDHQFILVPDIEISIDDYRMRPTLTIVGGELELS